MKRIIIILSLLGIFINSYDQIIGVIASSSGSDYEDVADYYVSSSTGNDADAGTTPETAWKTIDKVNTVWLAGDFVPGDTIAFKKGDAFAGKIIVSESGTSGNPIVLTAYGTGDLPIINGFTTLLDWIAINDGDTVYRASVDAKPTLNMVLVDDVVTRSGRYPNNEWLYFESHSGKTEITDDELTDDVDWDDATVVIRRNDWTVNRNVITDHTDGTIIFTGETTHEPTDDYGYFIQDDPKTLDQLKEWYFKSTVDSLYMHFDVNDPDNYTIKVSTYDTLLYALSKSYVNIEKLRFEGSNIAAILLNSCNNIAVDSCEFYYHGADGINASSVSAHGSHHHTFTNNDLRYINNSAIYTFYNDTSLISDNIIKYIETSPGVGSDISNGAIAMHYADCDTVRYNNLDTVGYTGIRRTTGSDSCIIENNFVNYFCFVEDDGGGIYTGGWDGGSGGTISNNIVVNGIGNMEGTTRYNDSDDKKFLYAHGIYLDDKSTCLEVNGNTIGNMGLSDIFLHNAHHMNIHNNTFYDANIEIMYLVHNPPTFPDDSIHGCNIKENIFFAKNYNAGAPYWDKYPFLIDYIVVTGDKLADLGDVDSNHYARPTSIEADLFHVRRHGTDAYPGRYFTLTEWQDTFAYDLSSYTFPITETDTLSQLFEYNNTKENKTIYLDTGYVDVDNAYYADSIILQSFTSIILVEDSVAAIARDKHTLGWFEFDDSLTITKDGSNKVSKWEDKSSYGNDLIQASADDKPTWTDTCIYFDGDGVGEDMKTVAFDFEQPEYIYLVMQQVSFNAYDYFFDGNILNTGTIGQETPEPELYASAGEDVVDITGLTIDTWFIVKVVFNGESSSVTIGDGSPQTGDMGDLDMGGFTIGANANGNTTSNIAVKAIVLRNSLTESEGARIYNILKAKYID